MYAFPEVAMNGTYESREKYHRENLAKAFAIFTESETSKKELIHFEGINADRIFVLPLIPSQVIDLKIDEKSQLNMLLKWNLKKNGFIYYPAQFWSHKNHYNLLQALKILLDEGYSLKLVFSGSDKGNLTYVKEVVDRLEINDSVVFAGFVSEEEVFSLYKNALCMCMPTLLGPTNMPLLEAYYLDCPVVCSNLDGHREQMQERAIYFDPCNPKDIAESIKKVQLDQVRTQDKRELFDINSIGKKLNNHFLEIAPIRKSFGFDFDQF
jgi:glycosyltransferase involved in cell wall biosynthesis